MNTRCSRCSTPLVAFWYTDPSVGDLCAACADVPDGIEPPPARESRLLIVTARHEPAAEQGQRNPPEPLDGRDTAGAVFVRDGIAWLCVRAAPVLDWMVGLEGARVKRLLELPKNAWRWRYAWASRWEIAA